MTNRTWTLSPWIIAAVAPALSAGPLACSDEVEAPPPPSPQFTPRPVDFGRVSVVEEKTLDLVISNTGGSPYRLDANPLLEGNDFPLFELGAIPSVLTDPPGLPIGATATIAITFRPCPAAIADPSNTGACPLRNRTAQLTFVDNSEEQGNEVVIQGVSTLPPNLQVRCGFSCGAAPEEMGQCNALSFGQVTVGESCALPVGLRNADIGDDPVADVRVENLAIQVQNIVSQVLLQGPDAGFQILTLDGEPLQPTFADPLVVAIPPGASEADYNFQIVFTPPEDATYTGLPANGNGFRITYNDLVDPVRAININAFGTGPRFDVVNITGGNTPFESGQVVQFRGVTSGDSLTWQVRLANNGTADMTLGPIELETGDSEFTLAYDSGEPLDQEVVLDVGAGGDFDRVLEITYAPTDDEPDTDTILVSCSTPACEPFRINLAGGAQPILDVSPPQIQYDSVGGDVQCRPVTLANVGDANLVIDELEIGIAADNEESRDDFFVDLPECGRDVPSCAVDIQIAVQNQETVDICYENGDSSINDAANLQIRSNDPTALNNTRTVALIGRDSPCFPPEIGANVPQDVVAGTPAVLDLTPTAEAPGGLGGVGGVLTQCTLRIVLGDPFPFDPNPVTAESNWEAEFTPAIGGLYIVEITCQNNCGAESSGQELINVQNP